MNEKYEIAADAFKSASVILELRRLNYQTKLESYKDGDEGETKADLETEIKEVSALIDDIKERIQDCIESRGQLEASKQAMNEFESVSEVFLVL